MLLRIICFILPVAVRLSTSVCFQLHRKLLRFLLPLSPTPSRHPPHTPRHSLPFVNVAVHSKPPASRLSTTPSQSRGNKPCFQDRNTPPSYSLHAISVLSLLRAFSLDTPPSSATMDMDMDPQFNSLGKRLRDEDATVTQEWTDQPVSLPKRTTSCNR